MKTKYKYIHFEKTLTSGKTKHGVWDVVTNKDDSCLGSIGWLSTWRCYVFSPNRYSMFSQDCLADIIDFIKQLGKK